MKRRPTPRRRHEIMVSSGLWPWAWKTMTPLAARLRRGPVRLRSGEWR